MLRAHRDVAGSTGSRLAMLTRLRWSSIPSCHARRNADPFTLITRSVPASRLRQAGWTATPGRQVQGLYPGLAPGFRSFLAPRKDIRRLVTSPGCLRGFVNQRQF